MKMVVAIVHNDDAGNMVDALLQHEFRATRLATTGGFLRKSNATLLIGVEDDAVDEVISILRSIGRPRSQEAGPESGQPSQTVSVRPAVVFVINVGRTERL